MSRGREMTIRKGQMSVRIYIKLLRKFELRACICLAAGKDKRL
jgi:hypothetical protein